MKKNSIKESYSSIFIIIDKETETKERKYPSHVKYSGIK